MCQRIQALIWSRLGPSGRIPVRRRTGKRCQRSKMDNRRWKILLKTGHVITVYLPLLSGEIRLKTRIVSIGNSKGIRIPKPLLEQTGLHGEVEISAEEGSLVIRAARKPREGWEEALKEMARRGDDALLGDVSPSLTSWDEDEWEWE